MDKLDQRRIPERGGQGRRRNRRGGLESSFASLMPPLIAYIALQHDLAANEPGAGAIRPAALPDLGDDGPELDEGPGELGIIGWPYRGQRQMGGSAALGPLQHRRGMAVFERHPQAQGRGLAAVAGRVSAQVGRSHPGPVFVQEPYRGVDRDFRAAAISIGTANQSLAVPGPGADQDRTTVAGPAGLLPLLAPPARPAPVQGGAARPP